MRRRLWLNFVQTTTKRLLQIKAQAKAADFYTPNRFSDIIVLKNGCPWMLDWTDHELVNNKTRWEALGVINGHLILGYYLDFTGNDYLITQIMADVEIDVDFDEFQEWYKEFTTFQLPSTRNFTSPEPNQFNQR